MANPPSIRHLALAFVVALQLTAFAQTLLPIPTRPAIPLKRPSDAGEVCSIWSPGLNNFPEPPSRDYLTNAVACAMYSHIVVLKADGSVRAWGDNTSGQCNVPSGLSNVVAVDAGYRFTLALQADGTIIAWGLPDLVSQIPSNLRAVAIAAGGGHALALLPDGTVASWGFTNSNLGDLPPEVLAPRKWSNIVAISASDKRSAALRADGVPIVAGYIDPRQPDVYPWNPVELNIAGWSGVVAISICDGVAAALTRDGNILYKNDPNNYRESGIPITLQRDKPKPVLRRPVVAVASGRFRSTVLMDDGSVDTWGDNFDGGCEPTSQGIRNVIALAPHGALFIRKPAPPVTLPPATRPTPAGSAISWLFKPPAQTLTNIVQADWDTYLRADGTVITTYLPPGLSHVVKVGRNWAILEDGSVVVEGASANPPIGLTNVYDVTDYGKMALLRDGSLVSWPYHSYPINPEPFVAISRDSGHTIALRPDGTVVTWGMARRYDSDYLLQVTVPPGISNVISITAKDGVTAVATAEGRFFAWGTSDGPFLPPTGITNAVQVAGQAILKADGTVIDWTGTLPDGVTPTPPAGLTNVLRIGAYCAIVDSSARSDTEKAVVNADSTAVTLHINTMPGVNYWITAKYNATNEDWTNRIAFAAVFATNNGSTVQLTNVTAKAVFEIAPQPIIGMPTMVNGGVASISIPRNQVGGYATVPIVHVVSCGPKTNATAVAIVNDGVLTGVTVTNPGGPYGPCIPVVQIDPPVTTPPLFYTTTDRITVSRLVAPGHLYQFESSTNLIDWTSATLPTVAQTNRLTLEVAVTNRNAFYRLTELK